MSHGFSITSDVAGQTEPAERLFPIFHAAGFTAVHWCQHWYGELVLYSADFAQQVAQLARQNGLRVADVHGYGGTPAGITYTDELFAAANINRAEFAAHVGAGAVVLHLPLQPTAPEDQSLETSVRLLRAIRPAFERHGVRAALENLPWSSHTDAFIGALLGEFEPEFLGFCYDSGHALVTGQAHLLERHADRLIVTHLHDNDGSADQHRMPGEGKVAWPQILHVLKHSGYRGTINLEVNLPPATNFRRFCKRMHDTIVSLWEQVPEAHSTP